MRPIFVTALFIFIASAPAYADWSDRSYPDAGFGAQFPAEPQIQSSTYRTRDGTDAPATLYAARDGHASYTILVADLTNTSVDNSDAIADAIATLRESGEIKIDVEARINREWGHELTVAENDGSRSTMGIFFFNHHLYELRANVVPAEGDDGSADALRFQQSLRFIGGRNGDGNGPDGRRGPRFRRRPFGSRQFGPDRFGPDLIP